MAKTEAEKLCKGCNEIKSKSEFVTVYGQDNPRGKYCHSCYMNRERKHVMELMDGRDFCLYCGRKILKYCEYDASGRSIGHYMELDHMDPISRGGVDQVGLIDLETGELLDGGTNTVYCCRQCNRRKRHMPFCKWVETLAPEYRALSLEVYKEKNGGCGPGLEE